jgi:cytochrome c556
MHHPTREEKQMIRSLRAVSLAFAAAAAVHAPSALAQANPELLVKQRQSAMTLIGKYWGPINGMAQGKVPYDAQVVARNAAFLDALSQMPWDGFDPSTKGVKSRALPAIWENPEKFKEAQERLRGAIVKLVAAANSGNQESVSAAAKVVGKACGACHNDFREKQ